MSKEKFKTLAKVCLHLFLQVIFSKIVLFENLSPVGLSFAFFKLFSGSNIFSVTGFYFLSKIFMFGEVKGILITAYEIVFLSLYYFANEFVKTNKKKLMVELFLVLSNVLKFYFEAISVENVIWFFINLILETLLLLYFCKFNSTYKNKLVFYKFSKNDYFVFGIMILLISLGIFSFSFSSQSVGLFILFLYIIFAERILPLDRFFVSLTIFALGSVFSVGSFLLFQVSLIFAVVVSFFKEYNKWFYITMCGLSFLILLIIFNIFNIFSIILVFFAIFLFIFVPQKVIQSLSSCFETNGMSLIFRKVEDGKVSALKNRLLLMSDTLKQMQNNFKFLLIGKIDREKACEELSKDVISKCCKSCENYRFCFMENLNKKDMFKNLMMRAIESKVLSHSDLSNGIQAYCHKSGIVVSETEQLAKMFLSYESAMKQEDAGKLLIASELGNFADIFENFAKTIKYGAKINEKSSKNLKESLFNALIDVREIAVFESELGIEHIDMIVLNEIALKKELADVISKTVRNRVQIKEVKHLSQSGFCLATFIPKPKILIDFYVSSKAKEDKNGDSSVILKLSDSKYFVAIADGMGHGSNANRISSMILNLIKSMFEVGFDINLIIESVNKLLIPAGVDNFTTLDACVVDIEKCECVFIKLGASVSVLKHKETSEMISSASLPIGIVESIRPTIVKKQIYQGDMIFLASDGVVDSFPSVESYATFINDSKIYNMQKFLDNVIFDAESLNQKHLDDMTIIGINLLKN